MNAPRRHKLDRFPPPLLPLRKGLANIAGPFFRGKHGPIAPQIAPCHAQHMDPPETHSRTPEVHVMAHLFKRGKRYYLKYYVAGKQKEKALGTDVYQIAREKQRKFESGLAAGNDNPLPSRTPIARCINGCSGPV